MPKLKKGQQQIEQVSEKSVEQRDNVQRRAKNELLKAVQVFSHEYSSSIGNVQKYFNNQVKNFGFLDLEVWFGGDCFNKREEAVIQHKKDIEGYTLYLQPMKWATGIETEYFKHLVTVLIYALLEQESHVTADLNAGKYGLLKKDVPNLNLALLDAKGNLVIQGVIIRTDKQSSAVGMFADCLTQEYKKVREMKSSTIKALQQKRCVEYERKFGEDYEYGEHGNFFNKNFVWSK